MNEPHPRFTRLLFGSCALCGERTRGFCEMCNAFLCEKDECQAAHTLAVGALISASGGSDTCRPI
jgi:hypothetical protein